MTTTISDGTNVTTPRVDLSASQERPSRNLVHELVGSGTPDVTLRPAGARAGTLELVYSSEATARVAEQMHADGATFTLTDDQHPARDMTYILAPGRLAVRQELPYQRTWILAVPYQEV